MYFEIVSGRPGGEVYHREVYVAFSREDAEECEAVLLKESEEHDNWLWGPHIYERDGDPTETKDWNGFELEAAPVWVAKDSGEVGKWKS